MLRSSLPQVVWPAVPDTFNAQVVALLHQFEISQWWSGEVLQVRQFGQLAALLAHFGRSSDFMQPRLAQIGPRLSPESYLRLPALTRAEMRARGDRLFNVELPPGQEQLRGSSSSGSTGKPVTVRKSEVNEVFHEALNLRNHVWHERDFELRFAAIRRFPDGTAMPPTGETSSNWVSCLHTGPYAALNSAVTTVDEQIEWLLRVQPDYLFSYPSLLAALARTCERRGVTLPFLRGTMGFGEVATGLQRAVIRRVFGDPLRDTYSASEVSTIALQCPEHEENYHVMSESVLVEIVGPDGTPCPIGVPGRVLITDLHNLMTPLLRYEIGDVAEWGPPCPCGRGLPVLRRIVGRTLNLLQLPNGDALVPDIERQDFHAIGPIDAVQVVQRTLERMEVRIVARRPLEEQELNEVGQAVRRGLHGRDYVLEFSLLHMIPRSEAGKFEAFVCAIDREPANVRTCFQR